VQSFLTSSAVFWLDKFHADGIRVDGVTSMLHLDFGRAEGQWVPNRHGGRENLDAVSFLRRLNDAVHREYPDALTIAEEATAWPRVTAPTRVGGLGFDLKWDMGWMHDTLRYLGRDATHRRFHHHELTFRRMYAYSERYLLALSHDEVVYGKGSLLTRMPGDEWQKFANLRLLLSYMLATPGKKLVFMGGEFGQRSEWNHDSSLDWHQAGALLPQGVQLLVRDLNRVYAENPALYTRDHDPEGFDWIDANDSRQSTLFRASLARERRDPGRHLQLHARGPPRLLDRGRATGLLARAHQHGCQGVWRQRPRQSGRRARETHPEPQPPVLDQPDPASARRAAPEPGLISAAAAAAPAPGRPR
jgi:1,4-alpha-glucan branching enzyme